MKIPFPVLHSTVQKGGKSEKNSLATSASTQSGHFHFLLLMFGLASWKKLLRKKVVKKCTNIKFNIFCKWNFYGCFITGKRHLSKYKINKHLMDEKQFFHRTLYIHMIHFIFNSTRRIFFIFYGGRSRWYVFDGHGLVSRGGWELGGPFRVVRCILLV